MLEKISFLGDCPTAINKPLTSIVFVSFSLFVTSILVSSSSPFSLVTLEFNTNSILSLDFISSKYLFSPLNSSLLWIKYTLDAISDKYIASSKAVFPPPTIATSLSL